MAIPRCAVAGSVVVLLTFVLSVVLLLMDGNMVFAFVSVIPVVLTAFVLFQVNKSNRKTAEGDR